MQLLKESDRMVMAQQARGPVGGQPSLAEDAVTPEQPMGLAAMAGQPVMAQAPAAAPAPMEAASGGLASMPTPDHDYAEGGIVAFAAGGRPSSADYMRMAMENIPQPTSLEEREAGMTGQQEYVNKLFGPDRMAPYLEDIAKERKSIEGNKDRNMGYALIAAAQGIVSDPNLARAAGKAMGAFGSEMQKLDKEDREAKRALRQSEMTLAAAQQARDDGKTKQAIALFDKYNDQKRDADKMVSEVNSKNAQIEAGVENAKLQAQVSREGHAIQREGQNRPGEIERMVKDYEGRLGRKLSAEELKDAIGEFSEARGGYRYTGPDGAGNKDIAKYTKQFNDTVAFKQMQKSMPGVPAEKIAQLDREIEDERKKFVANVQRIRDELGGASGAQASSSAQQTAAVKVTSKEQFDKLPSGTTFVAPDGSVRIKP
jgi:Sec-independent protein translocase protein TatA